MWSARSRLSKPGEPQRRSMYTFVFDYTQPNTGERP